MVLEYANGGELYKRMQDEEDKRFTETKAANYIRQLTNALIFLHRKGVIHRDIKPENLLLHINKDEANPTKREVVKLADFGWSVVKRSYTSRMTMCGTLDYLPPEMVEGQEYDENADIWSVGVLLFEFLVGNPPFVTPVRSGSQYIWAPNTADFLQLVQGEKTETYDRIASADFAFPDHISAGAQDLIGKLLQKHPTKRLPLQMVQRHPWMVAQMGILESSM